MKKKKKTREEILEMVRACKRSFIFFSPAFLFPFFI